MKKNVLYSVLAVAGVGIIGGLSIAQASAYRGDPNVQGPNYTPERHAAMEQAFDTKNYESWKALMEENGRGPRVLDVVNAENFPKFVEAHEKAEAGDTAGAAAIREELGLGNGNGARKGSGDRMGRSGQRGAGNGNCVNATTTQAQ